MALEKTWASRLVARLEQDGLIKRTPHPSDRRSVCFDLTAKGRNEQRKLADGLHDHATNLLQCVPVAERANVERALGHLRDALTTCLAKCGPGNGRC
jgi:DNA-binding MarR family transcriptional regulator